MLMPKDFSCPSRASSPPLTPCPLPPRHGQPCHGGAAAQPPPAAPRPSLRTHRGPSPKTQTGDRDSLPPTLQAPCGNFFKISVPGKSKYPSRLGPDPKISQAKKFGRLTLPSGGDFWTFQRHPYTIPPHVPPPIVASWPRGGPQPRVKRLYVPGPWGAILG